MGLLSGVNQESEDRFLQLLNDSKADCDLDSGAMLLAPTKRNLRDLAASIPRRKQEYGLDDYIVAGKDLRTLIGGRANKIFEGALVMPAAKHLHPDKMVVALASYARLLGVRVCENTELKTWRTVANGLMIQCGDETVSAKELLLTMGGYGGNLSKPLWKRTLAIPSIAAVTEELTPAIIEELLPSAFLTVINRFRGYNFRLSPDGRRIILAGPVATAPRTMVDDLFALRSYFERLFPLLAYVEFTHCWTGYAGAARDRRVHMGKHDGAWYSIGASGLVYSAEAGRKTAIQIATGEEVSDSDFPVWPLRGSQKLLWSGIATTARVLDGLRFSRQR